MIKKSNIIFDRVLVDAPCSGTGAIRKSVRTLRIWNPNMVKKIANELDTDAIIETEVLCYGDTICMQLKLIRTSTEEQIWAQQFKVEKSQIFDWFNQVSKNITDGEQLVRDFNAGMLELLEPILLAFYYLHLFGKAST